MILIPRALRQWNRLPVIGMAKVAMAFLIVSAAAIVAIPAMLIALPSIGLFALGSYILGD